MTAIDEIKQKIDIVEIIGQYTALKKAGKNLTGLCPFHSEKHPSFFVFPERQSWHCFGACNTGGDVFSFIMKKEGIDFSEALRLLAQRAGVTLPSRVERGVAKEEKDEFYQANEAAAIYYNNLLANSGAAEQARAYVNSRGFLPQTVAEFLLGFSTDSWDSLKQYLNERGHHDDVLLRAGLLVASEHGRTYDRFRGKLMFPIRDARGRVTGFGARALDNSLPKYTNSPQTPTFDKSSTLYGIDRAAASIRRLDAAIVMEGYMDVITAHQNGVDNTVACMGTALTETQVNALKKLTRNVILSLDADTAGEEAMLRGVGYENTLGAEIKVIKLPEGKDPDDVIKKDTGAWHELVAASMPIIDFTFEKVTSGLDLTTARDKSAAVERLLPLLAEIRDPVRQAHYLQKLAGLVNVGLSSIETAMGRLKSSPSRIRAPKPEPLARTLKPLMSSPREEYCLSLLLKYPELKSRSGDISAEYFENTENREIFVAWQESSDTASLKERLDAELHAHLDTITNRSLLGTNDIDQRYTDCVMELRRRYFRNLAAKKAESGETAADEADRLKEVDEYRKQRRPEVRR